VAPPTHHHRHTRPGTAPQHIPPQPAHASSQHPSPRTGANTVATSHLWHQITRAVRCRCPSPLTRSRGAPFDNTRPQPECTIPSATRSLAPDGDRQPSCLQTRSPTQSRRTGPRSWPAPAAARGQHYRPDVSGLGDDAVLFPGLGHSAPNPYPARVRCTSSSSRSRSGRGQGATGSGRGR